MHLPIMALFVEHSRVGKLGGAAGVTSQGTLLYSYLMSHGG